jgi:signal transduction histidine kinase
MEILSSGILETEKNNKYPSKLITRIISPSPATAAMVILEDKLEEQRKISLQKFRAVTPPTTLQKRSLVFATALAHEVRNPLTNINLAADMLNNGSLDAEQNLFVDIIKRGVEGINNLLTAFLASSKKEEIQSEICSIHELLEEVITVNKDRIILKHIAIRKDYASFDDKIRVNKEEIKIALINVVVNAIEAMPPENGTLKLSTRIADDKCIIEIEDDGVGISKINLKNIFNPFFTDKLGGMGIGLSTTLDILLSNCATMEVQSEEGVGTRFSLFFNKAGLP